MKTYQFSSFISDKNINHGISTKDFGSMKNEDNSINRSNIEKFLEYMSMSKNAVCMEQIHGGNVAVVADDKDRQIKNADGVVTNKKNISLCVVTADCLPVLVFDPIKQVAGAAHCGRKGLIAGIIKNVIDRFKNDFKSDPKDIVAGIGPGIEKSCYEVDGVLVDLRELANEQLLKEGVTTENIENIDVCTKCEKERFFSYRGGDTFDRFATVISII